jgi:putative ABC transport system permease protein
MTFVGSLHLAWRYLVRHAARTLLLVFALGLTLFLPIAVRSLVEIAQQELRARALATPLVLGSKGSAVELTLNALYFRRRGTETFPVSEMERIRDSRLAKAIPLYVRFNAQGAPIVGTSLDYFSFRGLHLAEGRMLTRLGDCLLGAKVAKKLALHPGEAITSSPEQVFDISGTYPLKMRITGVLEESGGADDDAVFVDTKTTWLIEGIGHGHQDVTQAAPSNVVIEKKDSNVSVTKEVQMFTEVTDQNLGSFHFHGDAETFPLTAVLVLPKSAKSSALLLGRYQKEGGTMQLLRPAEEMDALLASLFQMERFALLLLVALGLAVLLITTLVFALSFRMRRREFATLEDIGVARSTVLFVKGLEILLVGTAALGVVWFLWLGLNRLGPEVVRFMLR